MRSITKRLYLYIGILPAALTAIACGTGENTIDTKNAEKMGQTEKLNSQGMASANAENQMDDTTFMNTTDDQIVVSETILSPPTNQVDKLDVPLAEQKIDPSSIATSVPLGSPPYYCNPARYNIDFIHSVRACRPFLHHGLLDGYQNLIPLPRAPYPGYRIKRGVGIVDRSYGDDDDDDHHRRGKKMRKRRKPDGGEPRPPKEDGESRPKRQSH